MNIEKISLAVQVDGKACFVVLGQDNLRLLLNMATSLSDNGKLNVIKAPDDFKFMQISDLTSEATDE